MDDSDELEDAVLARIDEIVEGAVELLTGDPLPRM
jgi:hypothetical protein